MEDITMEGSSSAVNEDAFPVSVPQPHAEAEKRKKSRQPLLKNTPRKKPLTLRPEGWKLSGQRGEANKKLKSGSSLTKDKRGRKPVVIRFRKASASPVSEAVTSATTDQVGQEDGAAVAPKPLCPSTSKPPSEMTCSFCKKIGFRSLGAWKVHRIGCVYCDSCKAYVELKHLETCKGKKPKPTGPRLLCNLCNRLMNSRYMPRHAKLVHGVSGWKASEHPRCVSEEVYLRNLGARQVLMLKLEIALLKAQTDKIRREVDRLNAVRQELEAKSRRRG